MPQDSWYYFLAIESDLERTARFVEPLVANDSCYSVEFARLLMGAAAEAEAVATQFVGQLVTLPKNPNIDDLRAAFQKHYPKFNTMEILVPRASRKLIPWSAWAGSKNPEWWTAHNRVKHDRHNWFADASLVNTLNAVAGLLCLQLYVHQQEYKKGSLEPWCRFRSIQGHYETIVTGRGGSLPDFP
jgi:hypothetical protein